MAQFAITIPNLPTLQEAMANYSSIATPIVQKAVIASQAILAKFTNPSTVPVRTGYLVQNWAFEIGNLQARWYPRASYAPYVEFGTDPHDIWPVNKQALYWEGARVPVRHVNHPGTKANPFMERIVAAAQPEITSLFETAMTQILDAIGNQAA